VSKLRKTSPTTAGRLSRPFNICSRLRSSVIAIAVHRKEDVDLRIKRCLVARQELREASNAGALRAFRNADCFSTFKIFRFFWKFGNPISVRGVARSTERSPSRGAATTATD